MKKVFRPLVCIAAMFAATFSVSAATKFVTIGTGGVTGVYYPAGGSIAKMVNKKRRDYGIRATVESTGGSVFNVNSILAGDLEFGIVQSDRGYQAWNGLAEWEDAGKQTKLRSVFSLHPELVNLIIADDANISTCDSLKGKRLSVGNPGSGTRQNAEDALETCGLSFDDIKPEGLKASEGAKMLQDGRVDGYFYTVGHPNGSIKEAAAGKRKVNFFSFKNTKDVLARFPYYVNADIPVQLYPGVANQEEGQSTFGVKATLLSSSDVDADVVYAITKEVFENIETFKGLHPAFASLTKEQMLEGLTAPLHDGAKKYYKEVGLIQ